MIIYHCQQPVTRYFSWLRHCNIESERHLPNRDTFTLTEKPSQIPSSPTTLVYSQAMEGNKDEAIKCLSIAQKYKDAGNLPSARKFCQKSINLFSTPDAAKFLESVEAAEASGSSSSSAGAGPSTSNGNAQASSSSTETHPSASGAKHRSTGSANGTAGGMGGEKREFTAEQVKVVKRVKACKVTEYYEILSVKKDCEEAEIKKAYRKVH